LLHPANTGYKVLGALSAVDLTVRAGWGHKDTQGRVNPGKGRTMERHYTAAEIDAIRKGTVSLGIDETRAFELLGPGVDIYLNATTCRRCVPKGVWEYFIGAGHGNGTTPSGHRAYDRRA